MTTQTYAFLTVLLTSSVALATAPAQFPPHPRLLLPEADLAAVKQRMASEPDVNAFVTELKDKYDQTLSDPVTLPDRSGQWSHWYACKTHGVRLVTESPTRHVCPVDKQVYTGYPYDDVVIANVHGNLAYAVRDCGLLYRITGDRRYAERARDIALAYADRYLSYPLHDVNGKPEVRGGRVLAQTLDESIWLTRIAHGVDQIWDALTPDQIETLRTKLFYPAADGIRAHKLKIHNIQCYKNAAVGLVGFLFGDRALISEAIDGEYGYRNQLKQGVSPDGIWYEGTWGYHFYTLSAFMPLAEAAHHCGTDLYTPELRAMFAAPVVFAMPDGALPAFSDSYATTAAGNSDYELALARYNDPLFARPLRAKPRKSLYALLAGVTPLPEVPADAATSKNFPTSGYAILQTPATWLCLKYGPHGGYHGHPDKNSFVLWSSGKILADDPGNAPYGIPIYHGWYRTSLAHNTITVDQANQAEATGACLAFLEDKEHPAAIVDAGGAIKGGTFRRATFLLDDSLVVFLDHVVFADGEDHTIDLTLHPTGQWDNPATPDSGLTWTSTDPAAAGFPPDKAGYPYLRDLKVASADKDVTLAVASPAGPSTITFAGTGQSTTYFAGTGVGKNTEDRVPVVIARRSGKAATYAWSVTLPPAKGVPVLEQLPVSGVPSASAVRVRYGDKSWLLISNPEGVNVEVHGYSGLDKLVVR